MKTNNLFFDYKEVKNILDTVKNVLIVCDSFLVGSSFINDLGNMFKNHFVFSNFKPNPLYEDVVEGIKIFRENNCEAIIAVGGGSAIDTAKCIKLFSNLSDDELYFKQEYKDNDIVLIAIPTTCGTGSEATRFAVIYYNNEKQSIDSKNIIPNYVVLEASLILSLPDYQKKATMLDALSQAIESYWSVNSNDESKEYSRIAIPLIINNYRNYLENDVDAIKNMQKAAYYSGKAINISQTTAAHAMSYKLTSLYNIPHGHAVAMCLIPLWEYMLGDGIEIIDARGKDYYLNTMKEISELVGDGLNTYINIYNSLNINRKINNSSDIELLVNSVNPIRLKNHPVNLNKKTIKDLYIKSFNL